MQRARSLGFDLVRTTTPDAIPEAPGRLAKWLEHGSQVRALERQAEVIRLQLEACLADIAATALAPPGEQLALDAAASAPPGGVCFPIRVEAIPDDVYVVALPNGQRPRRRVRVMEAWS